MQRKEYTPSKSTKMHNLYGQTTNSQTHVRQRTAEPRQVLSHLRSGQSTLQKDYEALKIQVRQLEAQNRQLSSEVQKLIYEKSYTQNRYQQKANFEQETLAQFQKEKNLQIQRMQSKHEEEYAKLRQGYEVEIGELHRQLKHKEYTINERGQRITYLELKGVELKKELEGIQKQLLRSREMNSQMNESLNREQFNIKKLQILVEDRGRQNEQMQNEIHVLLDIEAQKSRTINALQIELKNAQNTQRSLQDKLNLLTDNFTQLEDHITIMKQRVLSSQCHAQELQAKIDQLENELHHKNIIIEEQQVLIQKCRQQSQQQKNHIIRRQREVKEFIQQNQRLYKELNSNKHTLHNLCVQYHIDL